MPPISNKMFYKPENWRVMVNKFHIAAFVCFFFWPFSLFSQHIVFCCVVKRVFNALQLGGKSMQHLCSEKIFFCSNYLFVLITTIKQQSKSKKVYKNNIHTILCHKPFNYQQAVDPVPLLFPTLIIAFSPEPFIWGHNFATQILIFLLLSSLNNFVAQNLKFLFLCPLNNFAAQILIFFFFVLFK